MNKDYFFRIIFSGVFIFIYCNLNSLAKNVHSKRNNPIDLDLVNPNIPQPLSHVSYKLIQSEKPNADELAAYKRIKQVMDSAIHYYNLYTSYS